MPSHLSVTAATITGQNLSCKITICHHPYFHCALHEASISMWKEHDCIASMKDLTFSVVCRCGRAYYPEYHKFDHGAAAASGHPHDCLRARNLLHAQRVPAKEAGVCTWQPRSTEHLKMLHHAEAAPFYRSSCSSAADDCNAFNVLWSCSMGW